MATPRRKNKPALRKAKATRTAAARKAGGKKTASKAAPAKPNGKGVERKRAATKSAAKPRKSGGAGSPKTASSPREKLIAVRPSGGKDDSFFELVHEVARQIPKGRVTSFGAIGAALGTRSSARMVGWAMNVCHLSPKPVPAHRVVNSAGLLTGRHHFKPPEKMQQLLEKEGVVVKDNKVVNFRKLFWDPSKEL